MSGGHQASAFMFAEQIQPARQGGRRRMLRQRVDPVGRDNRPAFRGKTVVQWQVYHDLRGIALTECQQGGNDGVGVPPEETAAEARRHTLMVLVEFVEQSPAQLRQEFGPSTGHRGPVLEQAEILQGNGLPALDLASVDAVDCPRTELLYQSRQHVAALET